MTHKWHWNMTNIWEQLEELASYLCSQLLPEIWLQIWDKNVFENIGHWNYFQIPRALSELPANCPRARGIWKYFQRHIFSPSFLSHIWGQISQKPTVKANLFVQKWINLIYRLLLLFKYGMIRTFYSIPKYLCLLCAPLLS